MTMKCRMRRPIADTINWLKDKRKHGLLEDIELVDKKYQET